MAGVLIKLDFVVHQGTFRLAFRECVQARAIALTGPSGAGKTTVLETIAGLRRPVSGLIEIDGRILFSSERHLDLPVESRRVGYVPQDVALVPHMNVRRNIFYGQSKSVALVSDTVLRVLEISSLLDRNVAGLSGGERQRVAIARALMSEPELLLLDEPLAAVGHSLKERILPYVERVRHELNTPLIYVSHSLDEVNRVSDQVITLEEGQVVESKPTHPVS